jgi:hypothetical protein
MGPDDGPTRLDRLGLSKLGSSDNRGTVIDQEFVDPPKRFDRLLRKEVIQPPVPLRLPCYDFTPVTSHTMDGCAPCGFDRRLPVQLTPMV